MPLRIRCSLQLLLIDEDGYECGLANLHLVFVISYKYC